jgi:hypothetical protein
MTGAIWLLLTDAYVQVKPPHGSAPPLAEGQKYFYDVVTTNAPGTAGFLEIGNSPPAEMWCSGEWQPTPWSDSLECNCGNNK